MINIQDIIPFMKKGWVAMDFGGEWFWYNDKPTIHNDSIWHSEDDITFCISLMFDIAPADDWEKSLIQVKGVKTR